jgi:hypothetical protein
MLRWVFFSWALLATVGMIVATPRLLGFGEGPYGDAALVFGWASLFGLPGWLIVAALTFARWSHIPRRIKAIQNTPAILSALLYVGITLIWSR